MAGDLKSFLQESATRTEQFLKSYISSLQGSPTKLTESMEYSLYGPGKRIRPALALLCCRSVRTDSRDEMALPAGAALEMIHCFSLIHDDLPAMDNDDLRRGRPTNHKVYGDALAILAGDALNTIPFEMLAKTVPDPVLAINLIKELGFATGPEGMIGGQVLDTCYPQESRSGNTQATLEGLQRIHRMKTGALIKGACRMGALAGGATPAQLELIDTYGKAIGLAFQIVDDILDVTASAEVMGKKTGKDAAIGKLTYPVLLGLDGSKKHLADQVAITEDVVKKLGPSAQMLVELSYMMAHRTH